MSENVAILVYGKGFIVSRKSTEFQLILPHPKNENVPFSALESEVVSFGQWARLISGFYDLSEGFLENRLCLLVNSEECLLLKAAKGKDSYGRDSVFVFSGQVKIDWSKLSGCISTISKLDAFMARISRDYSGILSEADKYVCQQVESGRFINSRIFDIQNEEGIEINKWRGLLVQISEWSNIKGVAHKDWWGLGANILIGTEHEAMMFDEKERPSGVLLPGRDLQPLSDHIHRWPHKVSKSKSSEDMRSTREIALGLEEKVERMPQAMTDLIADRLSQLMVSMASDIVEEIVNLLGKKKKK